MQLVSNLEPAFTELHVHLSPDNGIEFPLPLTTIKHAQFLFSHTPGMRVSRYEGWEVSLSASLGHMLDKANCPVSELSGRILNDISLLFYNPRVPLLQCF